jgi:hypothetical protein
MLYSTSTTVKEEGQRALNTVSTVDREGKGAILCYM